MSMNPNEVIEALQQPRTIYAPDGTTFVLRAVFAQANIPEELFTYDPLHWELTGPGAEGHVWLASAFGDFIESPTDVAIPAIWRAKAEIALSGHLALDSSVS